MAGTTHGLISVALPDIQMYPMPHLLLRWQQLRSAYHVYQLHLLRQQKHWKCRFV